MIELLVKHGAEIKELGFAFMFITTLIVIVRSQHKHNMKIHNTCEDNNRQNTDKMLTAITENATANTKLSEAVRDLANRTPT